MPVSHGYFFSSSCFSKNKKAVCFVYFSQLNFGRPNCSQKIYIIIFITHISRILKIWGVNSYSLIEFGLCQSIFITLYQLTIT
jgi:hypothetical protein